MAPGPLRAPTVCLLAGEASGDLYGAALARELRARFPGARLVGYGGRAMRAEGVELLADLDRLAVMGVTEVVPRLPAILRTEWRVRRILATTPVDLLVPIDYPGLNLRLAGAARRRDIPVLYYVPPKLWAWGRGRAKKLADRVDIVASVLPFETELFDAEGVDARYVGHPLLDRDDRVTSRDDFCRTWGLDPERRFLAVLPGSRAQEVRRLLRPFVDTAERVRARRPEVLPVLSRGEGLHAEPFLATGLATVTDTRGLLRHADAALVKSGTATLEATLEGLPHVIAYAVSASTWRIARRVLRTEHVGLPNLVLGSRAVPEFIQDDMRPEVMADALLHLLTPGDPVREAQREQLRRAREALGPPGASQRVADLAAELIAKGGR